MFNLWIGLCKGVAALPKSIHILGYEVQGIEFPLPISPNITVKPELIMTSKITNHTALLEWKEGANTDRGQLGRYASITEDVLRRFIDPVRCKYFDVVFIGKREHEDRILIAISKEDHSFPVLMIDAKGIYLVHNDFSSPQLEKCFQSCLEIDFEKIPTHFIPFDAESELWEVAERVIPYVVEQMRKGEEHIVAEHAAIDLVPTYENMGKDYKRQIQRRIEEVFEKASQYEFSLYLRENTGLVRRTAGSKTWDVILNPLQFQPSRRGREYRRLQRLFAAFLNRLKTGLIEDQYELPLRGTAL